MKVHIELDTKESPQDYDFLKYVAKWEGFKDHPLAIKADSPLFDEFKKDCEKLRKEQEINPLDKQITDPITGAKLAFATSEGKTVPATLRNTTSLTQESKDKIDKEFKAKKKRKTPEFYERTRICSECQKPSITFQACGKYICDECKGVVKFLSKKTTKLDTEPYVEKALKQGLIKPEDVKKE